MSRSENDASLNQGPLDPSAATKQLMTGYSTVHGGSHLVLSRKAGTKAVKARNDQRWKCTGEDQSEETGDQLLPSYVCPQQHSITIVS